MSVQTNRDIIIVTAARYSIPAWIPLSIADCESEFNERCIGDNGTSFGLFQLHRGGLAPDDMTDELLFDPQTNASIAVSHMQRAFLAGSQEGLDGIALLKYVAFNSGWPGSEGVAWMEQNRPDYVQRLSKMYLAEVDATEATDTQAQGSQDSQASTPDSTQPKADVTTDPGTFTAYETWYISPGDTLTSISTHVNVPVDVIARFNKLDDPNTIIAGHVLLIPRAVRVKAGDTLASLCEQYGAGDYHFIAAVNAHVNPDLIFTGETLYM